MAEYKLELKGICKSFPGVKRLTMYSFPFVPEPSMH